MGDDDLEPSGWEADNTLHPLAGVIRRLDETADAAPHDLSRDVLSLRTAAGGDPLDPHSLAASLRLLREHLTEAERLARSLPDHMRGEMRIVPPHGADVAELITAADGKLSHAEGIVADLCNRTPADRRALRNARRDGVARVCAAIFRRRKPDEPIKASADPSHTEPSNRFSGFVHDVIEALGMMDTPTAWFRPAQKAARTLTATFNDK